MDVIYLKDLRIDTVIGVHAWERRIKQTLILDVEMAVVTGAAAQSGHLGDTVSYQAVAERLSSYVGAAECELLETLAEQVATLLLDEFRTPWCRLRINKRGAVPGARDVGIIIERGSRD